MYKLQGGTPLCTHPQKVEKSQKTIPNAAPTKTSLRHIVVHTLLKNVWSLRSWGNFCPDCLCVNVHFSFHVNLDMK